MAAAKKTRKKRTTPECTTPDTLTPPTPELMLSIDPGRTSGWAIWLHGDLHSSGVATKPVHRQAVVDAMGDMAIEMDLDPKHVIVVFEKCAHGTRPTVFGLGRAEGRWLEVLEQWGTREKSVFRFTASSWRRRLWGTIVMRGKQEERRAQWKLRALTWVETYHHVVASTDDEAEAILIGDAYLHPKPPKKKKKARKKKCTTK